MGRPNERSVAEVEEILSTTLKRVGYNTLYINAELILDQREIMKDAIVSMNNAGSLLSDFVEKQGDILDKLKDIHEKLAEIKDAIEEQ